MADLVTTSWCKMPSETGLGSDVAIVTVASPPVNALSAAVRKGLLDAVVAIDARHGGGTPVAAVILRGEGRCFIAGGDLTEFDGLPPEPHLPDVASAIENASVPWLALMHGAVLGGGVEIALSCAWRLAAVSAKFGMPEINVGVIPGAGGTQRLPRLVGADVAGQMIAANRQLDSQQAYGASLIDGIVGEAMLDDALAFLSASPERPMPLSAFDFPAEDLPVLTALRDELCKKNPLIEAPLAALDVMISCAHLTFTEAMIAERKTHLALRSSAQSKALRHVFFAERQVGVLPKSLASSLPMNNHADGPIERLTVVGGGLMGCGIGFAGLLAGMDVCVIDRDDTVLAAASAKFDGFFEGALKRGKLTSDTRDKIASRLTLTTDYSAAANSDLAIEAVFEDIAAKQAVFASLASVMRADAIIATNTSYLDPNEIAENVAGPERVVGLHFFNPAHVMKLVEIVRCQSTSATVLGRCFAFAKMLGKTGVLAGVCDGFIGNRILMAYRRQSDYMLADGALPEQIDRALEAIGLPMGPYRMQDASGLQIAWANRQRQAATRAPAERYVSIADTLYESGRMGQRTGAGWYQYPTGRTAVPDPIVAGIIAAHPGNKQMFDDTIIQERVLAVMVNEGLALLDEGVASRPLDIDMVKILGYGFPRYLGGPMHHASHLGFDRLRAAFEDVRAQSPHSWHVAAPFDALADGTVTLAELNGVGG